MTTFGVLRLLALFTLLGFLTGANAQTVSGSIVGSVTDPAGLAVASAGVTLVNTDTGVERNTLTTSSGDFAFNAVQPGAYRVAVVSAGFKKAERTSVNL